MILCLIGFLTAGILFFYSPSGVPDRSVVVVGQESAFSRHIPYNDPAAMLHWYERMQRRLTILETQVDRQRRRASAWKYLLLALTVINPIIVNYFFFSRRRWVLCVVDRCFSCYLWSSGDAGSIFFSACYCLDSLLWQRFRVYFVRWLSAASRDVVALRAFWLLGNA